MLEQHLAVLRVFSGEPFSGPKSLMHAVLEVEHEEFGGTTEETESPNSTDQPIGMQRLCD